MARLRSIVKRSRDGLFMPSLRKRFWSKVNKTESCWMWLGPKVHGYGQFSGFDIHILAHRYAYLISIGTIANGLHLHHKCRNKSCVNPAHLEALSAGDHIRRHAEERAEVVSS